MQPESSVGTRRRDGWPDTREIVDSVKEFDSLVRMDFVPAVAGVRAFNRGYTKVIGVLEEGLLRSSYSLTEVRVLFEIAHADPAGALVADIREGLALDAGYLSRILARFETEGLVVKSRAAEDGRRSAVALTAKGRAAFGALDDRSNEQVTALLATLGHADRSRLVEAMGQISALLNLDPSAAAGPVLLREPGPGDYGWVVERHGALYAKERGWDLSFEALVAEIVADYAKAAYATAGSATAEYAGRDAARSVVAREAFWIAEARGRRVGCVACVAKPTDDGVPTAQLRLLLVDPAARGLGVGARLVDECLTFARKAGYRRIVLYTVDGLTSARKIYEAVGFRLAEQRAVRKYGHELVEQDWVLELD
jgi:DNA-binding MarR family transcriptional regulator/ribosomal protein S18 acetylase RimI-like enzyme